jgi:hypothetical protein
MMTITHFPLPSFIDINTSDELIKKVEAHLNKLKTQQEAQAILDFFKIFPQVLSFILNPHSNIENIEFVEKTSINKQKKLLYNIANYIEQYRPPPDCFFRRLTHIEITAKNVQECVKNAMGEHAFNIWQEQIKANSEKDLLEKSINSSNPNTHYVTKI